MARSFGELRAKMSPEAQKVSQKKAATMLAQMPLTELRNARKLSQQQLAEVLNVKQGSISKLERRADMYISTLRNFVQAMGGNLDIVARFPEGSVQINQFEELDEMKLKTRSVVA